MKMLENGSNYCFMMDEEQGIYYCFSYKSLVATYTEQDGFKEFEGPMYFSKTSVKHKTKFKKYLGI